MVEWHLFHLCQKKTRKNVNFQSISFQGKKKTRLIVETWGDCKNVVVAEIAERFCQAFELVEKLNSSSTGDISDISSLHCAWDRFNSLTDVGSELFGASVGIARGHHLRVKALETFMNAAVLFSGWSLALECGKELTPTFEKYYPHFRFHPQVAAHNVAVIKLTLENLMMIMGSEMTPVEIARIVDDLEGMNGQAKEIASNVSRVVGEDSTIVEQLVEAMHTSEKMQEQLLAPVEENDVVDETLSEAE